MVAPTTDGDVSDTIVIACYNNAVATCFTISNGAFADGFSSGTVSDSTGAYSVDNLQTAQYSLIALKDSDGNDSFEDDGDYIGIYLAPGATDTSLVTPPQTALTIQLLDYDDIDDDRLRNNGVSKALGAAKQLLRR